MSKSENVKVLGDSMGLRLQSVVIANVLWRRSIESRYVRLKGSVFSRKWNAAEESARGGAVMSKLRDVCWESVSEIWNSID